MTLHGFESYSKGKSPKIMGEVDPRFLANIRQRLIALLMAFIAF
jgi:hypothetical protein